MVLQVDEICSSVCVLCNVEVHVMMGLRTESADTQCRAFKDIVEIVTLFPGLRALLLHAKYIEGAASTEDVSSLWSRANGPPDAEWTFWQMLSATCLADNTISTNMEASTVAQLTSCDAGGLSVLERLLVEYDCS
jgi:hypothetical protein